MDVTVVVPFHNERVHLDRCLRALTSQTLPRHRVQLVLVDNRSTDGSGDVVRRYAGVRLLEEGGEGAYRARNRALEIAEGRFIVFTDGDCVARPDFLETMLGNLGDSDRKILIGRRLVPEGSGLLLRCLEGSVHNRNEVLFNHRDRSRWHGLCGNMALSRALFERHGLFNEDMRGADSEFVQRCVQGDEEVVVRYCSRAVVTHCEMDSAWTFVGRYRLYGQSSARNAGRGCPTFSAKPVFRLPRQMKVHLYERLFQPLGEIVIGTSYYLGYWSERLGL